MAFLKKKIEKVNFEKSADEKKIHENLPSMQRVVSEIVLPHPDHKLIGKEVNLVNNYIYKHWTRHWPYIRVTLLCSCEETGFLKDVSTLL